MELEAPEPQEPRKTSGPIVAYWAPKGPELFLPYMKRAPLKITRMPRGWTSSATVYSLTAPYLYSHHPGSHIVDTWSPLPVRHHAVGMGTGQCTSSRCDACQDSDYMAMMWSGFGFCQLTYLRQSFLVL